MSLQRCDAMLCGRPCSNFAWQTAHPTQSLKTMLLGKSTVYFTDAYRYAPLVRCGLGHHAQY